ncbi:MAG TPA: fibronectin type III domain-containing protein, partial [Pyrinomonadaceae bacterium]|nr:fibronectin type III domain-containing protein [Pyrinomonadaceae bacterium]
MKTRVVSRLLETSPFVFRSHLRLIVGGLLMALAVIAISAPSSVQSGAAVFLNPPALMVTATSNTSITLSWTAPFGADEYAIERGDSMSGPFKNLDLIAGTTFTDIGVTSQ